ncbi:MAG: hypothetical protein GVY13_18225 [Alphaproteobacteria bacterium]|jgi:hypothetical protein|nr:hypothetical protein [Alphaproteobacteria bacterium]
MTIAPDASATDIVRAMLASGPRPTDGEVTTLLIALHESVSALWAIAAPLDGGAARVLQPIDRLLALYRPVSLAGAATFMDFLVKDLRSESISPTSVSHAEALLSSLRDLRCWEQDRQDVDGTPGLRLRSPLAERFATSRR